MAKEKGVKVAMTDAELNEKINRIVAIRDSANEYRTLTKAVNAELVSRKLDSFTSTDGNTAMIRRKPTVAWLIDKLKKVLNKAAFELMCPRKADARKLNQRIAAMPEDKKLAACRVEVGVGKPVLVVLAKGETIGATNEEDDELEAAA